MSHGEKDSATLYAEFHRLASSIMGGGDSLTVYLKCNTMRNIWKEIRRRELPDPTFPERVPLKDVYFAFSRGEA